MFRKFNFSRDYTKIKFKLEQIVDAVEYAGMTTDDKYFYSNTYAVNE